MNIKGAIFDMDGTLLDSMHIWQNLGEIYLKKRGLKMEPGLMEKFCTMTLEEAVDYLRIRYELKETTEELIGEVNQLLEDFYRKEVKEKPGIRAILEELRQRGVSMCVASATDAYLVEYALEHTVLREYFGEIFCCKDVGEGKRSDKIYQMARESLGTSVEETVVFEDALYAAETAKRAGFTLVAIKDNFEENQERLKEIADYYFMDWREWEGI